MNEPAPPHAAISAVELEVLRRRLLRQARFALGDAAAAEDLVQDTLLDVLQGAHRHRGESTLTTWACAILKHKIADWYRAPARRVMVAASGDDTAPLPAALDAGVDENGAWQPSVPAWEQPEQHEERRQLLHQLQACVACLPTRIGRVFMLREWLGFENAEISRRLDLSADNVRQILHRARLSLRGCMQGLARPRGGR
ncbi:MAG: sigma-70 family RNA polymerase sigma factor [Rubrivivax sp.]|nr:sigma-70 family RNA polymerase sigma factor [Rubrivivax sp.]